LVGTREGLEDLLVSTMEPIVAGAPDSMTIVGGMMIAEVEEGVEMIDMTEIVGGAGMMIVEVAVDVIIQLNAGRALHSGIQKQPQ